MQETIAILPILIAGILKYRLDHNKEKNYFKTPKKFNQVRYLTIFLYFAGAFLCMFYLIKNIA